ncbi:MAG: phosphocholine cytidylyltransferase family protein [Candidatus Obscuribacterales bacterium]|nr:phosphocholine cytidylyltransferase family protein [Candidatus Obscuribacterales bacterium]
MKVIILAAGTGTRLRPLTENSPKCLVSLKDRPILEYQLSVFKSFGLEQISIVTGHMHHALDPYDLNKYHNPLFESTNMVSSLFCAKEEFNDDLIISYGDIIFEVAVVEKLLAETADLSVVIDQGWKKLWQYRMDDPLADAETLRTDNQGYITDIGRKTTSYDEIQGQYIGLLKISRNAMERIIEFYEKLDRTAVYDGKNFDNMYMTSLIQSLIQAGFKFKAVNINHGWLEVDSLQDLKNYQNLNPENELFSFAKFLY